MLKKVFPLVLDDAPEVHVQDVRGAGVILFHHFYCTKPFFMKVKDIEQIMGKKKLENRMLRKKRVLQCSPWWSYAPPKYIQVKGKKP